MLPKFLVAVQLWPRRQLLLALLILALAGCATFNPSANNLSLLTQPHLPFQAQGNEPPWQLQLTQQQLSFSQGYTPLTQEFTQVSYQQTPSATLLTAQHQQLHLQAQLTQKLCQDSMSGMPYPWQVQLNYLDNQLFGCGGNPLDLLLGEWRFTELNQAPLIANSHLTMTFTIDGQVYGSASCNRYTSSFTLTGESLTFKPGASTKMACPINLMQQEQEFLQLLPQLRSFNREPDGALILLSTSGIQLRGYPLE